MNAVIERRDAQPLGGGSDDPSSGPETPGYRARGYRSLDNLIAMTYLIAGKLDLAVAQA